MKNKILTAEEFIEKRYGNNSWNVYPPSKELVKEWLEDYAEYYHKAKVNAISDEEIDNFSENNIDYSDDKPKNNNDILILTATRKGVNYGAKWLKNKLLNDL